MSYARLGPESDVYVFSDGVRVLCMGCTLTTNGDAVVETEYAPMIAHLEEHRARGHKVPESALTRLREEASLAPVVADARLKEEPW